MKKGTNPEKVIYALRAATRSFSVSSVLSVVKSTASFRLCRLSFPKFPLRPRAATFQLGGDRALTSDQMAS